MDISVSRTKRVIHGMLDLLDEVLKNEIIWPTDAKFEEYKEELKKRSLIQKGSVSLTSISFHIL